MSASTQHRKTRAHGAVHVLERSEIALRGHVLRTSMHSHMSREIHMYAPRVLRIHVPEYSPLSPCTSERVRLCHRQPLPQSLKNSLSASSMHACHGGNITPLDHPRPRAHAQSSHEGLASPHSYLIVQQDGRALLTPSSLPRCREISK